MPILKPYKILVYHDQPQLFLATDQIGSNYLCMAIDSEIAHSEYFSIPISTEKLNQLFEGEIDLRFAFLNSEIGVWYKVEINTENEFIAHALNYDSINEKYLPEEGFYFPPLDIINQGYDDERSVATMPNRRKLR